MRAGLQNSEIAKTVFSKRGFVVVFVVVVVVVLLFFNDVSIVRELQFKCLYR